MRRYTPVRRCVAISGSVHAIDELAGEKSQSILVIDDDEAFRALARTSLENVGLAVWEAGTGVEAHACVRSCFPDLILLDATLSDYDWVVVADSWTRWCRAV